MKQQWINWFEIPVWDLHRATAFYETVFETSLHPMEVGPLKMAIFPGQAAGALVQGPSYVPSEDEGSVLYLDANPVIQDVLDRAEAAGARILQYKKQISEEVGYMALLVDSEGNRIALMAKG